MLWSSWFLVFCWRRSWWLKPRDHMNHWWWPGHCTLWSYSKNTKNCSYPWHSFIILKDCKIFFTLHHFQFLFLESFKRHLFKHYIYAAVWYLFINFKAFPYIYTDVHDEHTFIIIISTTISLDGIATYEKKTFIRDNK